MVRRGALDVSGPLRVQRSSGTGVAVLAVSGELDLSNSAQLRQPIAEAVESGQRHLVIDLSDCEFIDSTGLSVLVWGSRQLGELEGGWLAVVAPGPQVRRALEITEIRSLIPVFETRVAAEASLATGGDASRRGAGRFSRRATPR